MVKLIALYRKPENIEEFENRYFQEHMPLASKMPGLRRVEVSRMLGAPQGEADYYLMAEMYFDDMDSLKTAMSSPEGKAAARDVMSFAKDIITMMFAEAEEKVPATVNS